MHLWDFAFCIMLTVRERYSPNHSCLKSIEGALFAEEVYEENSSKGMDEFKVICITSEFQE